jgi:hypothetical protein
MTDDPKLVAIIGAGVGGLIAYVTLRYQGVPANGIALFDEHPHSLAVWTASAAAIEQSLMRSESEGHLFSTDFPGFALMDALHQASPAPLIRSVFNQYHPTLAGVVGHGQALARHHDLEHHVRTALITQITRNTQPEPHFALYDASGNVRCLANHVLLALGHGSYRWPAACRDETLRTRLDGLVYHAYQRKPCASSAVVVGAGMAAVHEWVNVLRRGGTVISVRRRPDLVEQALTAPRCAFGGPWLDRYHALDRAGRAEVLGGMARGTFPRVRHWRKTLDEATAQGRFRACVGEVAVVGRGANGGVSVAVQTRADGSLESLEADMLIAATGFVSGLRDHPVMRQLVADYGLDTCDDDLVLADDCTVPGVSANGSVLAVSGAMARWAYPASDSFAGMKYSARRFAGHVAGRSGPGLRQLAAWWDMVRGGWPYGADDAATERGGDRCATQ